MRAQQGEAEARLVKAKAEAEALQVVAEALQGLKGAEAAQLQVREAMRMKIKTRMMAWNMFRRK